MLTREKILKLDIVTPEDVRILSAGNKQFTLREYNNATYSQNPDMMLITKGKGLPEIQHNAEVFMIAYMRNGNRIKFPAYVSMSTEMQMNLVVRVESGVVLEERRRYYKVEVNIPCVVNMVERDNNRKVLESPYLTKVKDINIGGVFLMVCNNENLQAGDKMLITIDLKDRSLDVEAEILRVQKNAAGDIEGFGCRFVNMSAADEDIVSKYIIECQRERIQKELEDADE
ncbi:MAG: PilZ domain-containing protein [Ruminococcaceae bacterium]|nr:PilZ domain-containing protein [Oscillospiraceae bacterium]